jgi:hypothetical protein
VRYKAADSETAYVYFVLVTACQTGSTPMSRVAQKGRLCRELDGR